MTEEENLRKILSMNIKKQRELLGLTQEKLAEKAGISANMINDIEGCRTWVSDKTLIKLASSLQTEIYRFFMPLALTNEEMCKTMLADLAMDMKKIRESFIRDFDDALKVRGL